MPVYKKRRLNTYGRTSVRKRRVAKKKPYRYTKRYSSKRKTRRVYPRKVRTTRSKAGSYLKLLPRKLAKSQEISVPLIRKNEYVIEPSPPGSLAHAINKAVVFRITANHPGTRAQNINIGGTNYPGIWVEQIQCAGADGQMKAVSTHFTVDEMNPPKSNETRFMPGAEQWVGFPNWQAGDPPPYGKCVVTGSKVTVKIAPIEGQRGLCDANIFNIQNGEQVGVTVNKWKSNRFLVGHVICKSAPNAASEDLVKCDNTFDMQMFNQKARFIEGMASCEFKDREVQVTSGFSAKGKYRTGALKSHEDIVLQMTKTGTREDDNTHYWQIANEDCWEHRIVIKPTEYDKTLPSLRVTVMEEMSLNAYDLRTRDENLIAARQQAALYDTRADTNIEADIARHHDMTL